MLMIRRGAIVVPIQLQSPLGLVGWDSGWEEGEEKKNVHPNNLESANIFSPEYDKLSLLARYYADPLPVMTFSVESFDPLIEPLSGQKSEQTSDRRGSSED